MHVFAVASQKGGVGKTTVALNLAFAFAQRGWPTLIVDTDPLGAIGLSLAKRVIQSPGLADCISGQARVDESILQTKLRELRVLTAGQIAATEAMRLHQRLEDGRALASVLEETAFEVVIIDTPSGFVGATLGALRNADQVICPVQAEPVAARTMLKIFDVLGELRGEGSRVELAGFLLTMAQAQDATSAAIIEDLRAKVPEELVLPALVPRAPCFLEASGAGVPVGLLRRRPPPEAHIFDHLAEELERRSPLRGRAEAVDGPIPLLD
ncbi:MAG: ParA family protein [Myxococcota bacterium]